jgi:tetratricopeptide (TPR) repeat protein
MYLSPQTRSVSALVHKAVLAARELSHWTRARRHLAHFAIVLLCGTLGRSTSVRAGRYREAVVELERALTLDPGSPNLVYNLARVHELLGDIEQSIGYYERYRTMLPPSESEERQRVAGAIERLRGAKQHVERPSDGAAPPVVVRMERGVADGAFWTLATISLALREERHAQNFVLGVDGSDQQRRVSATRADRLAIASDGCLAVGAVGALTSILLYSLRSKPVLEPGLSVGANGWFFTLRSDL